MSPIFQVHVIESLPFGENTYVAWLPDRTEAIVIDPGLEPELIVDFLKSKGLGVAAILNTHGHADHIGGNGVMKQACPAAPLIIGKGDAVMLIDAQANLSGTFGIPITSPAADRTVAQGDLVEAAGLRFEVREIPGHSPGHVVYVVDSRPVQVFGGDVLFREGIGRFDFPGGSEERLLSGIRRQLFTLPDDTVIHPGHGPSTTVGHERRCNPYLASK